MAQENKKPSEVEKIKENSAYLRGTIAEGLENPLTGGLSDDDTKLLKFHGSYQQDDRDVRNERKKQKLEPAYQFMLRVRAPGGVVTPEQWLVLDDLAQKYGDGSLRLTTRQSFQYHGILKWNLKETIREVHESLLNTLAACGDVNRNVMCNPNPYQSGIHAEVYEYARTLSDHFLPQTNAYHEIWLDGEKVIDTKKDPYEVEPIYGKTYLPRKFKIGIAVPPSNDVDVYSQDLGFVAIEENGALVGFNVLCGGGMGMTHGDFNTYPQIGRVIGFCPNEKLIDVAEKIVAIQRDFGNRSDRKNARFKYTIDKRGVEWLKSELENRLGYALESPRPFSFTHNGDRYGWVKGDGLWHYTLFVQNGRVRDFSDLPLLTGLREIARVHRGDFRLTPNQNVIIARVAEEDKEKIETLLENYKLIGNKHISPLRRNSMACVALPTCGLAMAESERYLPELLEKIEKLLEETGVGEEEITIRMSGCPNGCSRPALAEIAFVGKAVGKYNLYIGGSFTGERLNQLYKENIGEEEILQTLGELFRHYARERKENERFGDFVVRKEYVDEVYDGREFHRQKARI